MRDPANVYAFHVPAGVSALDVEFSVERVTNFEGLIQNGAGMKDFRQLKVWEKSHELPREEFGQPNPTWRLLRRVGS